MFCYSRRQGWYLLGTIKANRKLDGVRVDQRERALCNRAVGRSITQARRYYSTGLAGGMR